MEELKEWLKHETRQMRRDQNSSMEELKEWLKRCY